MDPDGSLGKAYEENARDAVRTCTGTTAPPLAWRVIYWLDGDLLPASRDDSTPAAGKGSVDFFLHSAGGHRRLTSEYAGASAALAPAGVDLTGTLAPLHGDAPARLGLAPAQWGWRSTKPLYTPLAGGTSPVRGDLEIAGPVWATFYARVGPATESLATLPPGRGVYGAEACGGHMGGIHNGWDCARDHWWDPAHGHPEGSAWHPRLGDPYRLRDVDCHDGHLAAGVHGSLVPGSAEGACPEV